MIPTLSAASPPDKSPCSPRCSQIQRTLYSKVSALEAELSQLKDRYDALLQAKEAAAARYLVDYKKWRDFKVWLFGKNKQDRKDRTGLGSPEKQRHFVKAVQANCMKFQATGPRLSGADVITSNVTTQSSDVSRHDSDLGLGRENFPPTPASNTKYHIAISAATRPAQERQSDTKVMSLIDSTGKVSIPTGKVSQEAKPILAPAQKFISGPTKAKSPPSDLSSDTEEESQPFLVPFKPPRSMFPAALVSTSTGSDGSKNQAHTGRATTGKEHWKLNNVTDDPPIKPENSKVKRPGRLDGTPTQEAHNRLISENQTSGSGQKKDDYSKYKGRGRYARDEHSGSSTVNAQFQIDATRNGGQEFQFHDVVRQRSARRRMHGGDCECCHEYYEGIGPLPPLPGPPLWRSPTPNRDGGDGTRSRSASPADSERTRAEAIAAHKQRISRHRHHWSPPRTPPGYWTIGFPDTQEVALINRRAGEMHQRKWAGIEMEANKESGRYKRRRQ